MRTENDQPSFESQPVGAGQTLTQRIARGIGRYLQDAENGVLRPHQREVFEDVRSFFAAGHTRGYVELPTGTGKTVLFVEFIKAILSADTDLLRLKILVVTPTKDLVYQTIGKTGEKGFGRFASELKVGSYFSDTPYRLTIEEIEKNDVVVTTYRSFLRLNQMNILREATDEDRLRLGRQNVMQEVVDLMGQEEADRVIQSLKMIKTGETHLGNYDVIILDEAHHSFGLQISKAIDSLAETKVIIGFTATPDASATKKLTDYLPYKIHSLELNEAIGMDLLAPIVPIGIESGIQIKGADLYTESGDYLDSGLKYLAEDPGRNQIIVEAAKTLALHGIGTIVSCIAGNEAWHARYLAERLKSEGIEAAAVHKDIPANIRQDLYQDFERGQLEVLTFVGVLGEGWDSQRAKGLVAARPTRSIIFSKQRLGRVTRPGNLAFVIDIMDESDTQNPAINAADVLNEGNMALGQVVGETDETELKESVIESLQAVVPVMPQLERRFIQYLVQFPGLESLSHGVLYDDEVNKVVDYAIATKISAAYAGMTDEIMAKAELVSGLKVTKKLARQGTAIRTVYKSREASRVLFALPRINPQKYFVDNNGARRLTVEGLVTLFGRRYPGLTLAIARAELEKLENQLDWVPACYPTSPAASHYRHFAVVKVYEAVKTQAPLDLALARYFQLQPK